LRNIGLGAALAGAASVGLAHKAEAAPAPAAVTDTDILNFALNLEYLEAEYYLMAVYGKGLPKVDITGTGDIGAVSGGAKVNFSSALAREYAEEIATDEFNHVKFLRTALGSAAVARPKIDLSNSFTALAQAAGLISAGEHFDPFLNEQNFLLGAFIFEDVGVTAYNGALASISDAAYVTAAGSIMAVEAYHASEIRTRLLLAGMATAANKISALRAMLSEAVTPGTGDDQGITLNGKVNIVSADSNSLAFARTTGQVLNIVYGGGASSNYLFYPNKMNGTIS
jgi:Ferritin-like domain